MRSSGKYIVFPSQMKYVGRSKSKSFCVEQIDHSVGHVVAGNELHIDIEALLLIAGLLHLQALPHRRSRSRSRRRAVFSRRGCPGRRPGSRPAGTCEQDVRLQHVVEVLRSNLDQVLDRRKAGRDTSGRSPGVFVEKESDHRVLVQRGQSAFSSALNSATTNAVPLTFSILSHETLPESDSDQANSELILPFDHQQIVGDGSRRVMRPR